MFDIGLAEMAVIALVAIFVFGPEKLPDLARQAGRMARRLRDFATDARDDLRQELGPEFADLELRDLDPRQIVRKHIMEAMDDDEADGSSNADYADYADESGDTDDLHDFAASVPFRGNVDRSDHPGLRPLEAGEHPPYDAEAT